MPPESAVSIQGLTKHFKHVRALTDCSLEVNRGEVIGLLGPNGSGKSTLVRLVMGFLQPTSGTASVLGLDCASQTVAVHEKVAYLPGDARLFRTMRGKDTLNFFAAIRGGQFLERANALAQRFDLDLSRWVAFMSTGMRQKLALSVVMAIDSPVMILDEPTANLDPSVRQEVLNVVLEAQQEGRTILFSSHVLDEIEATCGRVVILRSGELVHSQSIETGTRGYQIRIVAEGTAPEIPAGLADRVSLESSNETSAEQREFLFAVDGELAGVLSWLDTVPMKSIRMNPVDLRSIYDRFHLGDGVTS